LQIAIFSSFEIVCLFLSLSSGIFFLFSKEIFYEFIILLKNRSVAFFSKRKQGKTIQMREALDKETYHSTWQAYHEAELEISGRYDKWVLTLSGGALGLSITFIEKIAKNPTAETLFWLEISWTCLILSLLSALLSLVTSQSAIRENRQELDLAHSENRAPRLVFPRRFTWITNKLNWGSLLLFIVGVVFLCFFSFKNIDQSLTNT
jgi:hypothetical protein